MRDTHAMSEFERYLEGRRAIDASYGADIPDKVIACLVIAALNTVVGVSAMVTLFALYLMELAPDWNYAFLFGAWLLVYPSLLPLLMLMGIIDLLIHAVRRDARQDTQTYTRTVIYTEDPNHVPDTRLRLPDSRGAAQRGNPVQRRQDAR